MKRESNIVVLTENFLGITITKLNYIGHDVLVTNRVMPLVSK